MKLRTITRDEIAKELQVKPQTVSDWAASGRFPKPLPGKNYLWSLDAVERYMIISSLPKQTLEEARIIAEFKPYM